MGTVVLAARRLGCDRQAWLHGILLCVFELLLAIGVKKCRDPRPLFDTISFELWVFDGVDPRGRRIGEEVKVVAQRFGRRVHA